MHLKSWRDCVMYLVLIDRFANGDPSNDDQGKGEFNRNDDGSFQGGDLRGVIERLPHIKKLGCDAIWITPPVHNQWLNPDSPVKGYHGYWAYDFTKIDPHFGNLDDYKELVKKAHKLGLRVVQDIVINHTGNFFSIDPKTYTMAHPELAWREVAGAYPPLGSPKAPNDPVFRWNDPRDPSQRARAIYNFTPPINDYNNREQTLNWSLADLDDLNLNNAEVLRRFSEIYRYWIDEAGIDGFRIDTVVYTPENCYERLFHGDRAALIPGLVPHASKRGIKDFFCFGEVWSYQYDRINSYLREGRVKRLDSAIDIPLAEKLGQVFFEKRPTRDLTDCLNAERINRGLWINFLDNHDLERISGRADWPSVRQGIAALFLLPGIPCVYYGTEAGLRGARENMFARKHVNPQTKQFRFLREMIRFRKRTKILHDCELRIERTSLHAGILAWELRGPRGRVVCAFNTGRESALYELPETCRYKTLLSDKRKGAVSGFVTIEANGFRVFQPVSTRVRRAAASGLGLSTSIEAGQPPNTLTAEITVPPRLVKRLQSLELQFDDSVAATSPIFGVERRFHTIVETHGVDAGVHSARLVAKLRGGAMLVSNDVETLVEKQYRVLKTIAVPPENSGGVFHNVRLPTHPSYNGQLTIEEARAETCYNDLRLAFRMASVTSDWNPANGYDHVYFSIYFDVPGMPGKAFLPKLLHILPDFRFCAGALLFGWGGLVFGSKGATPTEYGAPLGMTVVQTVDKANREVSFRFPPSVFGNRKSLKGVKIFAATWDGYLGHLHPVLAEPAEYRFSVTDGSNPETVPRIYSHCLLTID